jgi:hypothetical protein
MDNRLSRRAQILASYGANSREVTELLSYNHNHFDVSSVELLRFPLPDEPFVASWRYYEERVRQEGFSALNHFLPQLCFPIAVGISDTPGYQAATRQGADPAALGEATGLRLRSLENVSVELHSTPAGHIPLIIAADRRDFVDLVRAFTRKNEPDDIPDSMGACMIAGYPDWHRIRQLRKQYEATQGACWPEEFERIKPSRELYQDRFIILSAGPYSGVLAIQIGLDDQEWRRLSLVIRREHECTHYFTRRVFGCMRTNLLDELIADFFGIKAATGNFRSDWLLRFMGLEEFPHYRSSGRLGNYRGALSNGAFCTLQQLVVQASRNLESFDNHTEWNATSLRNKLAGLTTLSSVTLEEIAAPDAEEVLGKIFAHWLEVLAERSTKEPADQRSQHGEETATAAART